MAALLLSPMLYALVGSSPSPMVFIPGLTNSVLEYQLIDAEPVKGCPTQQDWQVLYPPSESMNMSEVQCWLANLAVVLNPTTQTFQSKRRGVNVRIVDFGGLDGMPALAALIPYWEQLGYVEGQNMFGAPYDWRIPTSGRPDTFYGDLQHLVEHAYAINNNRKVVLLAPSFGPQFVLGFLHRMTQVWKDQYIEWFVTESPVWSGVYLSLMDYVAGEGKPKFIAGLARQEIQSLAITAWMFPRAGTNPNITWPDTETIVSTPSKNYTAFDIAHIYSALNFTDSAALKFVSTEPDLAQFAHPGVNTLVTYGYDVDTPGPFSFPKDFVANRLPNAPSFVNVSGDGLVPLRSSLRATAWQDDMQKEGFKLIYRGYFNQSHAMCLLPPAMGIFDGCFAMVAALLVNGTVPTSDPF